MKASNPVLCAEVSYEFPLAPMDFYYGLTHYVENNIFDQTYGYFDLPVRNYHGDNYRHAPLLSGLNKRNLIEAILNAVQEGELPAYDYQTDEKLSSQEIEARCTIRDTMEMVDPGSAERQKMIIEEPHPLVDFNSLIFNEEWYIDKENGKLEKEVKEIALVKTFSKFNREMNEYELNKEIVFKIRMDED
jgi:hypothetical protein